MGTKSKSIWLSLIVGLVLISLGSMGVAVYNLKEFSSSSFHEVKNEQLRSAKQQLKQTKPINILLLGTDTGEFGRTDRGRTDTIMLMAVNPQKKRTTLISVPRDMRVDLAHDQAHSPAKVNAAYAYGGVGETIDTLQKTFNNPIDYYFLVNMAGLTNVINQIHGISVTSPITFNFEGVRFVAGESQLMDGATALKFSRMRHEDPQGDYGRQLRQRLVIQATLKKLLSYKTVYNQKLLSEISGQIQTNFDLADFTKLALNYRSSFESIDSDHVQGHSDNEAGQSFEVVGKTELNRVTTKLTDTLK